METESPAKQEPISTKTVLDSKASEEIISPGKLGRASNLKASKNMGIITEESPSPTSPGKKS